MTQPVREYRIKGRFAVDLNFDGGEGVDDGDAHALGLDGEHRLRGARGGRALDARGRAPRSLERTSRSARTRPSRTAGTSAGRRSHSRPPRSRGSSCDRSTLCGTSSARKRASSPASSPTAPSTTRRRADGAVAAAVARAVHAVSPELVVVSSPGSKLIEAASALGLRVAAEGFVDRAYEGRTGRSSRADEPGALVEDPEAAARAALAIVFERRLVAPERADDSRRGRHALRPRRHPERARDRGRRAEGPPRRGGHRAQPPGLAPGGVRPRGTR